MRFGISVFKMTFIQKFKCIDWFLMSVLLEHCLYEIKQPFYSNKYLVAINVYNT